MKKYKILTAVLCLGILITGCQGKTAEKNKGNQENQGNQGNVNYAAPSDNIDNITYAADATGNKKEISEEFLLAAENGNGIEARDGVYTITEAGVYTASGRIEEGSIVVDAGDDDTVEIILNGVSISSSKTSPINIINASEVKIKSEENTYNEIKDIRENKNTEDINAEDNGQNAAIFSKTDLSITGKGSLVVSSSYNNGIQSKKDIKVKNVTLNVTAVNNALKGNDSVTIESGEIILNSSEGNGIKTDNSDVSQKGSQRGTVTIEGGNIDIYSANDGIDAAYDVNISGEGNLNVFTGKYAKGTENITTGNTAKSNSNNESAKGIKADNTITIEVFTINIQAEDDGIHSNSGTALESGDTGLGNITVESGNIIVVSGDDGIHADNIVNINGGYVNIQKSKEGIEGNQIIFNGGSTYVYGSDDGVNASGKNQTPLITVNDGYLEVTTPSGDTDAIDSNGSYVQNGGKVLVKGGAATGNMAGSVDVDGKITVNGGTIMAIGGICETPENSCNAYSVRGTSFTAGKYTAASASGTEIIAFELTGNYTSFWICSDKLATGEDYILTKDGTEMLTWTQEEGTMGDTGNFGGGFGGRPGGMGGKHDDLTNMPDGMEDNGEFATRPDGIWDKGEAGQKPGGMKDDGGFGQMPDGAEGNGGFGQMPDGAEGNGGFGQIPDGMDGNGEFETRPDGVWDRGQTRTDV